MVKGEQWVGLAAAVAGLVVLQKYAGKEAKALGVPALAVSAAVWFFSQQ